SALPESPAATGKKQPVLVELYTSEGCSSCPPADRVLSILQNDQLIPNANVITLGFHVDYWDNGGWKDRFSSHDYTARQEAYARQMRIDSTYTPQMVVDGSTEFVGSNRAQANDAIAKVAAQPKGSIDLKVDNGRLFANISGLTTHNDATVYLAVTENGLTTSVGGGENAGEKLVHSSIVRQLVPIGTANASDNSVKLESVVPVNSDWKTENLRYVVFVQENNTLKVLAVNQTAR
ncbi:MAG: DUF1223 domain-containing protein, partial [Acidobacteriota bacterium]